MNQAGSLALVAALAFAAYAVIAGAVSGKLRSMRVLKSAERATLAFCVMITLAVAALEYLILTDNFHSAYAALHLNWVLPLYFKLPELWAGPDGTPSFVTGMLAIYTASQTLV